MALAPALARRSLRGALRGVRHVTPVPFDEATGVVREVYEQLERDFGVLAPPVALHSLSPELLAASWAMLRETLLVPGTLTRGEKEAVAEAVSVGNDCPYCAEVHGAAREAVEPAHEAAELARWVGGGSGGCPSRAPAEVVGVAVAFHYLNRVVNVFLPESPLPASVPAPVGRFAGGIIARMSTDHPAVAGESLPRLAASFPRPGRDLTTTTFAAAGAVFGRVGRRAVPVAVREVVRTQLRAGQGPLAGPWWVDRAIEELDATAQPLARLALLVASESHRVDDETVRAARTAVRLDDRALVELVGWSAFVAAHAAGADLLAAGRHHRRGEEIAPAARPR